MNNQTHISGDVQTAKLLIPGMRLILVTATILVLGAGLDLFLFPKSTDTMFAWNIQPALTAAFLGANYLAACVVELGAARQRLWSGARVVVPAVMLFTVLTALLTIRNFNDYNLKNPMAWIWIIFYLGVPPALGLVWWKQCAAPGSEPPREALLPRPLEYTTLLFSMAIIGFGLILIFARWASPLWPWLLSSVGSGYGSSKDTAMETYVGVWLLAWGTLMIHATIENDLLRIRYIFAAFITLAALQSLAIYRFSSTVTWSTSAAIYLATLATLAAIGIWGWIAATRARKREDRTKVVKVTSAQTT